MATIVNALYYIFAAFIGYLCIRNFLKSRNIQEEILYMVLAASFALRVLHIK